MDRMTEIVDGRQCTFVSDDKCVEYRYGDDINKLAAYEGTGLSPDEVMAMKAEYSDTFQAHLNQQCDIKDRKISVLIVENQRLKRELNKLKLFGEGKKMRLDEIKIPDCFVKTPPKQWKLEACREYFKEYGRIDRRIIVDKKGVLRDGYVGYLVLKEQEVDEIDVTVNSQKQIKCPDKYYIFAVHNGNPKEYIWRVPGRLVRKLDSIGHFALVNTRNGQQWVRVKRIAQLAKSPHKKVSEVVAFSIPA